MTYKENKLDKEFDLVLEGVGKVHFHEYGHGDDYLVAFHGYGMTGRQFSASEDYLTKNYRIIAMDLFFHGKTVLQKNVEPYFSKDKLYALVRLLLHELQTKRISIAGYSLGARLALCVIEQFAPIIQKIYLLAPEGIQKQPLLYFFNNQWLFNHFFRHHQYVMSMFRMFKTLGFIDDELLGIILREIDSSDKIWMVHKTFRYLSGIKPHLPSLIDAINQSNIKVTVISGMTDFMFPPKKVAQFLDQVHRKKHIISPSGHWVFSKKTDELLLQDNVPVHLKPA